MVRADEDAADALASSLRQDRTLLRTLRSWERFDVWHRGGFVAATEIASDHVRLAGRDTLIPVDRLGPCRRSEGRRVLMTGSRFVSALRTLVGARARLFLADPGEPLEGSVTEVCLDHLVVSAHLGRAVAVPLNAIVAIERAPAHGAEVFE